MSVVAKTVEENYRSTLRGSRVWCGDDDRWSVRHGWQRRSTEDVKAISAVFYSETIVKRGVSVPRVLSVEDPSARQNTSKPFPFP